MEAHDRHPSDDRPPTSSNRSAVQATLHCLTGCAIGEVLGMVLATGFGCIGFRRATRVAFASDTASITTMELIDNAFILVVPGAMAAGLGDGLFWWTLALSLVIAFVLTVPVNRWLIARGRGHAVMHELHAQ